MTGRPALAEPRAVPGVHDCTVVDEAVGAAVAPEGAAAPSGFAPTADLLLPLITVYQEHVGPHSVARCPFAVSCSRYAQQSISQRGFFGLLQFLDRFFFRESIDAYHRYEWAVGPDGSTRLDDYAPWIDARSARPRARE